MTRKPFPHGRHCRCSACARQDWTDPKLAPCGIHGPECAREYAPYLMVSASRLAAIWEDLPGWLPLFPWYEADPEEVGTVILDRLLDLTPTPPKA